jgi:hypothetical protein
MMTACLKIFEHLTKAGKESYQYLGSTASVPDQARLRTPLTLPNAGRPQPAPRLDTQKPKESEAAADGEDGRITLGREEEATAHRKCPVMQLARGGGCAESRAAGKYFQRKKRVYEEEERGGERRVGGKEGKVEEGDKREESS